MTAIVGASGTGQSMLGALAGRLVDPDEGDVLLDGVSLRSLRPQELREAISYAFEYPHLIGETVADAIGFAVDRPPLWRIVEAACAARADDFIRSLPRRYATPLRDAPLSGGERQRLGLARSFVRGGRLVILDDVASSLDTVTEHRIRQVLLDGELSDRTRVVVANRASTAASADRVVWLADGGVRAVGTHAELCREAGYRELFDADRAATPALQILGRPGGS
jgi:ATP-binding cassette subfamily B protein